MRRVVEDELRRLGVRLRDLDVRLELGLQESVRSAVLAGYGVTFISRTAVEAELAAGTLAEARVEGMDGRREISIAVGHGAGAATGRPGVRRPSRASGVGSAARGRVRRSGPRDATARPRPESSASAPARSRRSSEVCAEVGDRASAARHDARRARRAPERSRVVGVYDGVGRTCRSRQCDEATRARAGPSRPTVSSASAAAARSTPARRSSRRSREDGETGLPRDRRRPDDVRRRRVDAVLRDAARARPKAGGSDERADAGRRDLRPRADPRPPARRRPSGTAMNALAHCAEAYYHPARTRARRAPRGHGRDRDRPRAAARRREARRDLRAHPPPRGRVSRRARPRGVGALPRSRDGAGARWPLRPAAGLR